MAEEIKADIFDPNMSKYLDEFDQTPVPEQEQTSVTSADPRVEASQSTVDISESLNSFEGYGVRAPEDTVSRMSGMELVEGVSTIEDATRKNNAMSISKETGVPVDIAEADLLDRSPEQIKTKDRLPDIARNFPDLAKWMSRPENYVLAEQNIDWAQRLSKSLEQLNPEKKSDVMKAYQNAVIDYERALVDISMLGGIISLDQGKKAIREYDRIQAQNEFSAPVREGLSQFQERLSSIKAPFRKLIEGVQSSWGAATDDSVETKVLPQLSKVAEAGGETFDSFWEAVTALYHNPEAAKIFAAQSVLSSAPAIIAAPVGAALGTAVSPGIGTIIGSYGLPATVSFVQEFSARLRDKMEEFRDPETNQIDYDLAFSDPERLARWRKEAAVYASVIAASDAVYSNLVGNTFTKLVRGAGKSAPVKAAVGVAAEAFTGAVEEGASNLTAAVAEQAYKGELTPEAIAERGQDIATDIIGGGVTGGAIGATIGSAKIIYDSGRGKYSKLKNEIKKTNDSVIETSSLSDTRAKIDEEPVAKTHINQVKELVDDQTVPPPFNPDPDMYEDVETASTEEINEFEQNGVSGHVLMKPSEIQDFFNDRGLTPEVALADLPPAVFDEYVRNKDTDTSINVRISDWLEVTEHYPEIDAYVRVNGQEMSGVEATEEQLSLEAEGFKLFQRRDDETALPPIPVEDEAADDIQEAGEGDQVTLLDDLSSRFRNQQEKRDFEEFEKVFNKILRPTNIKPDAKSAFREIQFRHLTNRADVLGVPVSQLIKEIDSTREAQFYGEFIFNTGDRPNEIRLSSDSDVASLIHEFSHSWLSEMSQDYSLISSIPFDQMTDAQRSYKESMDIAAEVLNIENVGVVNDLENSEAIHESFAQTAEKYFLEGTFENNRIRSLMEKMRKWLVQIAELVGNTYSQYPALEITPKVERMFEGILAPQIQLEEKMMPLFPEPMFDIAVLGGRAEQYYQTVRDALNESVGHFMTNIMRRSWREREKIIDDTLNTAYDEAAQIVDQRPEMQYRLQMEDQYSEVKKLRKQGRKIPESRISWNSFLEIFDGNEFQAQEIRKKIPYIVAAKKKGGVDVTAVMTASGINDADVMRDLFVNMSRRDELIEREAESIVKQTLPILKTDEEIDAEVKEALSQKKLTGIFNREMKILAENYLPDLKGVAELLIKSPESLLKEATTTETARKIITYSNADGFNSRRFRQDFSASSRKAARAFKSGDFTKAFVEKFKSVVSYKAYLESQKAIKQMVVVKKRIKQFQKYARSLDYAKRYDVDLMNYGRVFIEAVRKGDRNLPIINPVEIDPSSGVAISDIIRINNLVEYFQTQTEGRYGSHISVGNVVLMGEIVRMIQIAARNAKKVEIAGRAQELEDLSVNIGLEISGSGSAIRSYEDTGMISSYRISKDQVQTIIGSLYKNDKEYVTSSLGQLMALVDNSQAERNIMYKEKKERVVKAIEKAVRATRDKGVMATFLAPILRRTPWVPSILKAADAKPIQAPEIGTSFGNLSEYLMAELMMGSESGAVKFLMGGTKKTPGPLSSFDPDTGLIDRRGFDNLRSRLIEEGILKKEHFDALQEIWDVFKELHPEVKSTLRRVDGFAMGEVKGLPFSTPFGEYTGGYVPVASIKELAKQDLQSLTDPDVAQMRAGDLYPSMNMGMVNERNRNYYEVDLNMNRILLSLGAAIDIIHLREPLLTLGKVFASEPVRTSLNLKRPGAIDNVIVPWFNRIRTQKRTEFTTSFMDKAARKFRKNINRSIYLGRLTTGLIQYTGLINAAPSIGPRYIAQGALAFNTDPRSKSQFINDSSSVMRNRFDDGIVKHINEWEELSTNFDWIHDFDKAVDKMTYIFIQGAQNHVDKMIWTGAYLKGSKEGMTESESVSYANFVVQSTQASSEVSWLNNWQTGTSLKKLVTGIATSYIFSINNVVTRETARNPNKMRQAASLLAMGLAFYGLPQAVDAILRQLADDLADEALDKEDEDTEEEKLLNIVKRASVGTLGMYLPVVGGVAEGIFYTGRADFSSSISKISRETTGAVAGAVSTLKDVPLTTREMTSILNTITLFTGIPTSVLAKDFFIEDVLLEEFLDENVEYRLEQRRYLLQNRREQESQRY